MVLSFLFLSTLPSLIRLFSNLSLKKPYFTKDLFFGLGEDIFIGYQQVMIIYFSGTLLILPIALLQIYYIIDAFLYCKMAIRLNPSHFQFFKAPRRFLDSALAMGALKWFPLSFLVVIASYITLRVSDLSGNIYIFLPLLSLYLSSKQVSQVGHNALFTLESYLFYSFFGGKKDLKQESLPNELVPKSEEFTKVDPQKYPLLKVTEGFKGPLQFEVKNGRPKNIIFIFLESFRGANVGSLGAKIGVTPHFDTLSKKGVLFNHFYTNGTNTYGALFASLTGVPQIFNNLAIGWHHNFAPKNLEKTSLITIPSLLQKEGYHNLFIDSSLLPLENRGLLLEKLGFDEAIGKEDLPLLSKDNSSTSWGIHDEHLFAFCVDKIAEKRDKPLFTSIFTISNHHPWKAPLNYSLNKFEEIRNPIYRNFLQTMHYTDHCLNEFITDLEKRDLLKDSLFFIFGDHGVSMEGRQRTLHEEGVHIPLLIYGEEKILEPKVISDIGSQIDLLPTLMDLLDLKGLNHSIGTSLLRKTEARTIFFSEPPCLGNGFGLRCNDDKLIIENSKPILFDLSKEKAELSFVNDSVKIKCYETLAKKIASSISSLFFENRLTFEIGEKLLFDHKQDRFEDIDKLGPQLKSFQGENSLISDSDLKKIVRNCPGLEILNLSHSPLVSDLGFKEISDNLPMLKSLNLSYNTDITGTFLTTPTNWVLGEFTGCNNINDDGLKNISRLSPTLKKLFLSCNSLTDDGITRATFNLPRLRALSLSSCETLTDRSISKFKNSSLNHLTLNNPIRFTNECLLLLKNHPLYSLALTNAPLISDNGLLSISHHSIEELILKNLNLTDDAIPILKKLPLKHLILSPCLNFSKKSLKSLIDLNLELLVLKKCDPSLKNYLSDLTSSRKNKNQLYISFDGTPNFL